MPRIRVNGVEFHVEERGAGHPLVLLHGFTGSSASWAAIGDKFAPRHRVVTIDLIGHGATSAPPDASRYTFDRVLDDLIEIADQMGITQAAWLGYSMGGRLALGLALHFPHRVSSLILESATAGIQNDQERHDRAEADEVWARRIEEIGIDAFADEWERLPMWESQRSLPDLSRRQQREMRRRNRAIGLANSLRGIGQGSQPSYWDRLSEIETRVLLIAGALDRKFAGIAGLMAVRIPAATVVVVPGAGHAVHLERPFQFADVVTGFLNQRQRIETCNALGRDQWK